MYILINLSTKDILKLSLFDDKKYNEKSYLGQNRELLICIEKILKTNKTTLKTLTGLIVVVGHGGFTSTRIAVVTANTLAYTLKIPVIAINNPNPNFEELTILIPKIKKQPIGCYISASYSGEANIGKKTCKAELN